jgi:argonaute-like protein implicated in RNA metabolism and viral defense
MNDGIYVGPLGLIGTFPLKLEGITREDEHGQCFAVRIDESTGVPVLLRGIKRGMALRIVHNGVTTFDGDVMVRLLNPDSSLNAGDVLQIAVAMRRGSERSDK